MLADQSKGVGSTPEYMTLMKELRKLKGIEQKNIQLQQDNEKYWTENSLKDKEIIELKAQIKSLESNQDGLEKLKQDKKVLQEKLKKAEKEAESLEIKNTQLSSELSSHSASVGAKLQRNEPLSPAETGSPEYLEIIQQQMQDLEAAFEDSKKVLLKVMAKEKTSREKEDELVRLRTEKARLRDELRAELK